MKNRKAIYFVFGSIVFLFLVAASPRTGSITQTTQRYIGTDYRITAITWIADSTGAVAATTTPIIRGLINQIVTRPDTSLTPAIEDSSGRYPTDNYDITLKNADSLDVANGQLANRDTENAEMVVPVVLYSSVSTSTTQGYTTTVPVQFPFFNNSALTVAVTNNSIPDARGRIYIYWQEK